MHTVTSKDGTRIAYDRTGDGPPVILVGGALSHRKAKPLARLAEALSAQHTVFNYDRRGRGDSDDPSRFAVEREVDDLAALVEAAGGRASLWGWSSGGALALRAAQAGIGVAELSVYEVPFAVDRHGKVPPADYAARLDELLAAGDRSGAVKHFMTNAIGLPGPVVTVMRLLPIWRRMTTVADTLPYDWAALGDTNMRGEPLREADWAAVTAPTLVVYGSKSPRELQAGSRAVAQVLPDAELRELARASHNVPMKALAPILLAFFAGGHATDRPRRQRATMGERREYA